MPLILDADPHSLTANAFVTLTRARDYAAYRVGEASSAFLDLDADDQVRALVTAARMLDAVPYRIAVPKLGTANGVDVPEWLAVANIEQAFHVVSELAAASATPGGAGVGAGSASQGALKKLDVGPIKLEFATATTAALTADEKAVAHLATLVQAIILPYVKFLVRANYGNGRVVRVS